MCLKPSVVPYRSMVSTQLTALPFNKVKRNKRSLALRNDRQSRLWMDPQVQLQKAPNTIMSRGSSVTWLRIVRLTASQVRGHRNASQSRHISTCSEETVNQAFKLEELHRNISRGRSTGQRRLFFEWTNESKCEVFGCNCHVCVRPRKVSRWLIHVWFPLWRWRCDAAGLGWHLVGPSFGFPTWRWPQILLQAMEELEESDEVLGHMTWHLE